MFHLQVTYLTMGHFCLTNFIVSILTCHFSYSVTYNNSGSLMFHLRVTYLTMGRCCLTNSSAASLLILDVRIM